MRNFANPMSLNGWLSFEDETENCHIFLVKEDSSTHSQHLAIVKIKNKVNVLYTTGRQTTPTCSGCHSVNCQCLKIWKKKLESESSKKGSDDQDDEKVNDEQTVHYTDQDVRYGYNVSPILFPLNRCPNQRAILEARDTSQQINIPSEIHPSYEEKKCQHNNLFSVNPRLAQNFITVYSEDRGEQSYDCKLFYRVTEGPCKCEYHADSSSLMLYHVSVGVFIDYCMLNSFIINYVNCGQTALSFHKATKMKIQSKGKRYRFKLSYSSWNSACDGFVSLLQFDILSCFTCKTCKTTPKYFIGKYRVSQTKTRP